MKIRKIVTGLLMVGATASALANSDGATDGAVIGKVDTVYVREARGLYIEKKLLRRTESKDLWVDVRLATARPGEPKSELFKAPAQMTIERGDLVALRSGDTTPTAMNLIATPSRVTQVVARHDTLMAMTFGLSNSKFTQGYSTQEWRNPNPAQVTYAGVYLK